MSSLSTSASDFIEVNQIFGSPGLGLYYRRAIQNPLGQLDELNREDRHLPLHQRTGYRVILAMRPWRAEIFNELRKDRR